MEQWKLNIHSSKERGNWLLNIQKVNNGCNCQHVPVAVFSCKRRERSERQVLKFLIQALWDVALFQLVKGDFPQGIFHITAGSSSGRIMAFHLKTLVNFACFIKSYLLISDPTMILKVHP